MEIITIQWQETLPIRQQVLWPNESLEFCKVSGDESAMHFGIKNNNELLCVASVYIDGSHARLRKFATLAHHQGSGLGTKLLTHILKRLKQRNITDFWLHARESAVKFYQKFGLEITGERFYKHQVSYFKMTLSLNDNAIRIASTSDAACLSLLATKVWLNTYAVDGIKQEYTNFVNENLSLQYFQNYISDAHRRIFVLERGTAMVGFAAINLSSTYECSSNGYEIEKLYVDDVFQGQGIGKRLIQHVINTLGTPFWLYTWEENASNAFYTHLGFKHIGDYEFLFGEQLIKNHVYAIY